jgi:hypothetical protein
VLFLRGQAKSFGSANAKERACARACMRRVIACYSPSDLLFPFVTLPAHSVGRSVGRCARCKCLASVRDKSAATHACLTSLDSLESKEYSGAFDICVRGVASEKTRAQGWPRENGTCVCATVCVHTCAATHTHARARLKSLPNALARGHRQWANQSMSLPYYLLDLDPL